MRWRIAITTAGLTLLILVGFALVLGNLVGDRIRDDFEDELAARPEHSPRRPGSRLTPTAAP